jgi:integrase-like protein
MPRRGPSEAEHHTPVQPPRPAAKHGLPQAGRRDGGEPRVDAADRRAVSADAVLRQPADGAGALGQSQAGAAADASDGTGGDLPATADDARGGRTQDLPVFTAECGGHAAGPGVVERHHVRAAAAWILVLGGNHGLVQPVRGGLAFVETLEGSFCLEALDEALWHGRPEIFNSDQGSQFTALAFTARLLSCGVSISMDGRGRALDNVFVERLWRTVKYEEVYLKDYADGWTAEESLANYFRFYCHERIHQSLGYRTPAEVYRANDSRTRRGGPKSTAGRAQEKGKPNGTQSVSQLLRPRETFGIGLTGR